MRRISQLDSVRGIAILAVFFHHALGLKLMWMGVDLFFILSGFLITGVLLNARERTLGGFFSHFYARRARRILVPYLMLLLLASMVLGVAWMRHWYLYILLTNFLLPFGIPHPAVFEPLWSLAVEEQFYLVWPFAVYFLPEKRLRWLCVILLAVAPALRGGLHFEHHWPIYTLTPFRMDLLAAGSLVCLEWRSNRTRIEQWGARIGAGLAVTGLVVLWELGRLHITTYGNTRLGNILIYESALFICLGFMLYALSGRHAGWLQVRALRYIGTISYSMYLVHVGVLQMVRPNLHGIWGVAAALGLTILYASLSWHLIECRLLGAHKKPTLVPSPEAA